MTIATKMPVTTINQPIKTSILRTCSRCGQEFAGVPGGYLCHHCRKPRAVPNEYKGKPLSPRETQIVMLVAQALPNKEIAWQLHLSEGTVKEYLCIIFKKLGVQNRTELALWAMTNERNAA